MKRFLIALVPSLFFGFQALAQTPGTFTVTGTAQQRYAADELVINAGVRIEGEKDVKTLFSGTRKITQKVIDHLKDMKGVKKVESDVIRLQTMYNRERPNMYVSTQTLTIVLKDFSLYDEVMTFLLENGFNQIGYVGFSMEDMTSEKRKVQLLAIAQAKEKADVLAKAMGVNLGEVIHFSEEPASYIRPMELNTLRFSAAADASGGPSIAPAEVEITQKITITYRILED